MVGAAACSGGSEEAAITPPVETTPTRRQPRLPCEATTTTAVEATTTTVAPVLIRQPLTGEPLASEAEIVERPAMAVKIDNHPGARRNHSGLAVADIVFEEKVEGSLTRFAAVLHTQDADPLGPIRSGREQDVALLSFVQRAVVRLERRQPWCDSIGSIVAIGRHRRSDVTRQLLPWSRIRTAQPVFRLRLAVLADAGGPPRRACRAVRLPR